MGIKNNEKITADFIQKMAKRKPPFNDFSITKVIAPNIICELCYKVFECPLEDYQGALH